MSLVALILISSQFVAPSNAYTEIIDTNSPDQYNNTEIKCSGSRNCKVICDEDRSCSGATITCPEHFPCDITCSGKQSCETATITCPYGQSCIVNCNNARSCQSTTINAQYSSRFILNDCASDLSCNGMALYFPPNNGGSRALINGGDTLSSLNDKQLDFYAIFGWYDISVINYNGNFYDNTNAIMHCLPDYRDTCKFALDSWGCGHVEDSCNYPPTQQPTVAPSTNPTLNPTPIPTPTPTLKPTTTPTKKPTANPTQRPSLNPSKKPSQNPSTSTSSGTLPAIEKNTTQSLYDNDNDNDTDYVERVQRETGLEQVDILWLVTALLLSVLCFIMVILSYYMYHSRGKLADNNANNDANHKKAVRSRHRSISNFKSLKRNSKSSYMSEQDQTKMNKLIISALSENSNNKYTAPMKPTHLPRRKSKPKNIDRYRKHEMNPHNQHNNDAIANHAPKQETDAEYDQDHGHDHDVKEGAETVHVDNTLEWDENKNNESVVINVAEASRSYPQHNPYPNGNLNQLHEHSYSQSMPYTNNAENNENKHSKLTNGYTEQESVSSAADQPYAYYPKQKASSNGAHCSDGHPNPYLTEPQCSQIYSHAVGKLLYNHQLQQRPNTNDTNTNDANNELVDGNGIHTFGPGTVRKHPGFINTKLGDIDEDAVNIKVDENSNANSSVAQHGHHQNTLSVEIAANKILSPLSTVTASSIAPTQEDSDSSESESDGEQGGDEQPSETMNIAVRTNDFPLDLGTQMQQKHGLGVLILEEAASSSSASSSSSSSSSSSEDSSSSSSSTQYSLSTSESGEEDEELKQSEIAMCSEQKLQEWISTGAMDGHSMHGTNLNQFPYETQNQNNYNYLHHQRNVTMVIKHQNNNTLPLSNVDASASPIEPTQKVDVIVGDQMYESPFNQDLDNNVWNKHIYKSSVNTINTNVSSKKTYVECPVSVHDGDDDNSGSEKSIIDDNATTTSIATLEIQGLINV